MENKWIINQDRDEVVLVTSVAMLDIKPVEINRKFAGFNLLVGSVLLGTFDTLDEINKEIKSILRSKKNFYVVSGYSSY